MTDAIIDSVHSSVTNLDFPLEAVTTNPVLKMLWNKKEKVLINFCEQQVYNDAIYLGILLMVSII